MKQRKRKCRKKTCRGDYMFNIFIISYKSLSNIFPSIITPTNPHSFQCDVTIVTNDNYLKNNNTSTEKRSYKFYIIYKYIYIYIIIYL